MYACINLHPPKCCYRDHIEVYIHVFFGVEEAATPPNASLDRSQAHLHPTTHNDMHIPSTCTPTPPLLSHVPFLVSEEEEEGPQKVKQKKQLVAA